MIAFVVAVVVGDPLITDVVGGAVDDAVAVAVFGA